MVEWKKLGEVCEIKTGRGITQKDCSEDGQYPVISGGQTPMGMYHQYNRESKTVTISRVGAYAGYVSFINERFYLNDKCFSIIPFDNSVLNNKYLYSVLKGQEEIIQKLQSEGGVPTINTKKVGALSIPIPSLSEQQRIVSILDTFTSSISNLKQQIEERRKQYEYERDLLLDLEGKEGVEMKKLGEVCEIKNGYTPSTKKPEFWENGSIPWFTLEDIRKNGRILSDAIKHITPTGVKKSGLFPQNSIIVSTTATIGEYALITRDFLCNQQISCISVKEATRGKLLPKYLYYLSNSIGNWCKKNVNGGGSLLIVSTSKLNNLFIPLPPLSTQSRIVSILDTFEQSISNLEEQLAMREKQYEYYRNQLLTFEGEEERGKT